MPPTSLGRCAATVGFVLEMEMLRLSFAGMNGTEWNGHKPRFTQDWILDSFYLLSKVLTHSLCGHVLGVIYRHLL